MKRLLGLLAIMMIVLAIGCKLPPAPPYPYYDTAKINAESQKLSDDLESYIRDWIAGRVSAMLPDALIPDGTDRTYYTSIQLKNPDTMTERTFAYRKAENKIDFNAARGLFPDAHATYLMDMVPYGPFGSKVFIKGQFPHCRFFSIQPAPTYDPRFYYTMGVGESALVDADIVPDSGSSNPFLVGANRNAANRNYTVELRFTKGDMIALNNPAHNAPYYRGTGNVRYSSGIQLGGPWCDPNYYNDPNVIANGGGGFKTVKGKWDFGCIWIRYYLPDSYGQTSMDPFAGVPLPKSYQVLATGEKFKVWADPVVFEQHRCQTRALKADAAADPSSGTEDNTVGWFRQWGIFNAVVNGLEFAYGLTKPEDKKYSRDLTLGVTSMGESQPGIGKMEPAISCCNHINYLVRGIHINTGKVAVLAGKLPTFPNTRGGVATMTAAQIRYLSFNTYDGDTNVPAGSEAVNLTSICDDEMILDANRNYIIAYSRAVDKPANATSANKVSWRDTGPICNHRWTLRMLGVYPDWYFDKQPNELRTTWPKTNWCGTQFDVNILSANNRNGFLKEYQPVIYYMTKASFESLGGPVTEAKLKTISWGCGNALRSDSSGHLMVLIPVMLLVFVNGIWFFRRKK